MRGKKKGKIIQACVVVGILLVLLVLVAKDLPKIRSEEGTDRQMVYVEDHLLCYTPDMKNKEQSVVICQLKYDDEKKWIYYWGDGIRLSSDGKYIYFLNDVTAEGTGELCRIKINRISKDEIKNTLYIEELASDVVSYRILEDAKQVVYQQKNGRLLHMGQTTEFIAKKASEFHLCDTHILYTVEKKESTEEEPLYDIFAYDIKTAANEKLESNIKDFCKNDTADFILCTKQNTQGEDIYVLDVAGESRKIAENATYYWDDTEKKAFYYRMAEKNGEKEVLDFYKYVDGNKPEKILDNVDFCYVDAKHELFIFCKTEENEEEPQFYYKWKEQEGSLEIDKPGFWVSVSEDEKYLMIGRDNDEAAMDLYEKTENGLKKVEEVAKHTSLAGWAGDICYYYGNADMSKNTGDLCYYEKGKITKLMEDVYMSVKMYADGNYLAYRNYVFDRGGELYVFDTQGEEKKIAENVSEYTYLEKDCILYMEEENLYVYTGEESHILGRNVLGYRCDELAGDYL
ncbi:MAG: hypothetical protein J6A92_03590 [Lachnospiraceae bacterium]|nr:hypothetical protein [Lachnospiraceae bacterium]